MSATYRALCRRTVEVILIALLFAFFFDPAKAPTDAELNTSATLAV